MSNYKVNQTKLKLRNHEKQNDKSINAFNSIDVSNKL